MTSPGITPDISKIVDLCLNGMRIYERHSHSFIQSRTPGHTGGTRDHAAEGIFISSVNKRESVSSSVLLVGRSGLYCTNQSHDTQVKSPCS